MIGRIMCSRAGRDKGRFLIVVGETDGGLLVCDGKERRLEKPKLKNPKHLAATNTVLNKEQFLSNKSIRKVLCAYTEKTEFPKEED